MSETFVFICEQCNLYFNKPIILPCGNTLCEDHIDKEKKSHKCNFCDEEHNVPENGFPTNKPINKMINLNMHLSGKQKICKKILDNLHSLLSDYDRNQLVNPSNYIFEFFSNLKNQLDLHHELMISNINKQYLKLIEILNKNEKDCQNKIDKVEKITIDIDEKLLKNWEKKLQTPIVDESILNDLIDKFEIEIARIKAKIISHKSDLIDNKTYQFLSDYSGSFGRLLITHKKTGLNIDFGICLKTLTEHSMPVTSLVYNNETIISASEDKSIKLWKATDEAYSYSCVATLLGHDNCVSSIDLISDNILLSGSWDCTIKLWDLTNQTCLHSTEKDSVITSLCVLNKYNFAVGQLNGFIKIYNSHTFVVNISINAHNKTVCCLKLKSKSRSTFLSSSNDGSIKLWKFDLSTCIAELLGHKDRVFCLEIKGDTNNLISGSDDRTIKIWNLNSYEIVHSIDISGKVFSLKMINSPKTFLIIGTNDTDGLIQVYDFKSSAIIKKFNGHIRYVGCFLYLPNDNLISASGDGTIKIWNIN